MAWGIYDTKDDRLARRRSDAVLTTECQRPDCKLARQALDTAVGRAEEILKDLRGACADLDAIVCVENDTRHELGMPPKEDE